VLTLLIFLRAALTLVAYPWDWCPDEGLELDYARRVVTAPATLYRASAVPFPCVYGPVLPVLLAPIVASLAQPLAGARLLALLWTAAGTLAVFLMVRRDGSFSMALACASLALAAVDLTFWHMLVRPDGLMIALWLLAAAALLPRRLESGADRLTAGRAVAGTVLLLLAVLTKPTAVFHGAPLVLGWFLVDRMSALRLGGMLTVAGLAVLGGLQWATSGAFLWVNALWSFHASMPGQRSDIAVHFLASAWPLVVLALLALLALGQRRREAGRESSLLLLMGGLALVPATSKFGAWVNYLLPALPALAVLLGRWWTVPAEGRSFMGLPRITAAALLVSALALSLAIGRDFPLPTALDGRTAQAFYAFVEGYGAGKGGPILASRPGLAYFLVGQPAEIEGSSFPYLVASNAAGSEIVLARLRSAEYSLLVQSWPLPATPDYNEAIARSYVRVGGCNLGFFFGAVSAHLIARRDAPRPFEAPPGTRCGVAQHDPRGPAG
jgi:hypothetical protein